MADDYTDDTAAPEPGGIGAQLRAAREARGLTLVQVAAETRIPQRHLATIEAGDFAALPARTYAVGFSRNYAKVVGLNEDDVAELVRAELDAQEPKARQRPATFEPGDPARVPSSRLVWVVLGALGLLLLGGYFFMRTLFAPAAELPSLVEQERAEQAALAAQQRAAAPRGSPAGAASGPVVFTALEDGIWVKFYDARGEQLLQKLMARGERYTVPADAEGPQLWTGRPDALAITVGGRAIPRLADDDVVMRDVPVTAQALLARSRAPAASPTT
ncbi:MAG TPA: helix-turn-helix domain-containing protein [Croceibacterium sp.]|nr:helix-turn-helix domain-containing protein [Croceibacterium sp.]